MTAAELPDRKATEVDFYDEMAVRTLFKAHFSDICDDLGFGYVAEVCNVAPATVRSWAAESGKLPGPARMLYVMGALSRIEDNRLIENVLLSAAFRVCGVSDFRVTGDGCIEKEVFDLSRLIGRLADAAAQEDPEMGLNLMEIYDRLGKRLRGDFEAMKASER